MKYYEDVAQNCLFRKTRTVSRYITNIYTALLKDVGITPVQFAVLTALQMLHEANVNTLSEALAMDRTTLNRNLKPLLRDGFVYIEESRDRREKIIKITKKGVETYDKAYDKWKEAQKAFREIIGDVLYEQMHTVLDEVIGKLR